MKKSSSKLKSLLLFLLVFVALISIGCEFLKNGDTIFIGNELTTIEGYVYLYYSYGPLSEIEVRCNSLECETSDDGYFLLAVNNDDTVLNLSIINPYGSNRYITIEKEEGSVHYGPLSIFLNDSSYYPNITNVIYYQYFDENSTYLLEWDDVAYGGYEITIYDANGDDFPDKVFTPIQKPPFAIEFPSVSSNQGAYIKVESIETGKFKKVYILIQNI